MKVVYWNSNGLVTKISDVYEFIDSSHPDIFAVAETKYPSSSDPLHLSLHGYDVINLPHSSRRSGLLILISQRLTYKLLDNLSYKSPDSSTMMAWLSISSPRPLILAVIYLQPRATAGDLASFKSNFQSALSTRFPVVALGDFNGIHPDWDDAVSPQGVHLRQIFDDLDVSVLNSTLLPHTPTHHPVQVNARSSVLDLCIASDPHPIISMDCLSHTGLLASDHSALEIRIAAPSMPASSDVPHARWNRPDPGDESWLRFRNRLDNSMDEWMALFQLALQDNPTADVITRAWHDFHLKVTNAARDTVGRSLVHPNSKHWWKAPGVRRQHAAFVRARSEYLNHRSPDLERRFKSARSAWRRQVTAAKRAATDDLANKLHRSRKLLFSCLRDKSQRRPLRIDGTPLDPSVNADAANLDYLSQYYANVFAGDLKPDQQVDGYLEQIAPDEVHVELDAPITAEDVSYVISLCGFSTAEDNERLIPLLLKMGDHAIKTPLACLFNASWSIGFLPTDWKIAKSVPLHKGHGAPPSAADSYRIISITSIVCRTFERIVFNRLYKHLLDTGFLLPTQFGFRRKNSTHDAILILQEAIHEAWRQGLPLEAAFLDVVKAFDSVWHKGLLFKLHKAGVRGLMYRWIRNFLSGRSFALHNAGLKSSSHPINAGVPQGCVLSPLLFLVYINDIGVAAGDEFHISLFADDGNSFPLSLSNQPASLQLLFDRLTAWGDRWRLRFSGPKSAVVRFVAPHSRDYIDPATLPPLILHHQPVAYKDSYLYLGILHDDRLNFDQHHTRLSNKMARSAGAITHIAGPQFRINPPTIRNLVAYVLYGQMAYSFPLIPLSSTRANHYLSIVCRPLRRALCLPRSTCRLSLMVEYRLPAPSDFHTLCCARFASRVAYINQLEQPHGLHELPLHRGAVPLAIRPPTAFIKNKLLQAAFFNILHPAAAVPLSLHLPPPDQYRNWTWSPALARGAAAMSTLGYSFNEPLEFDATIDTGAAQTFNSWRQRIPRPSLHHFYRFVDAFDDELPKYMHDDTCRRTRGLRARMRFNRCHIRAALHRIGQADSPLCPSCHLPETTEHFFLHCSRTANARHVLIDHAPTMPIPITLTFLIHPSRSTAKAVSAYLVYCLNRFHI